jgi:hypothetical protein
MPTKVIDRIYQWVQPRTLTCSTSLFFPDYPRRPRVDIAFAEYGDPGTLGAPAALLPNSRHLCAGAYVSLMVSSQIFSLARKLNLRLVRTLVVPNSEIGSRINHGVAECLKFFAEQIIQPSEVVRPEQPARIECIRHQPFFGVGQNWRRCTELG